MHQNKPVLVGPSDIIRQSWVQDQLHWLNLKTLRSSRVGAYRSTKRQMPRPTRYQTAPPFYAGDAIDVDEPALQTPGWSRLYPLQRDGEAASAMDRRWARHLGCSSWPIH